MAVFTYEAVDRNGQRTRGSVPAESRASAMDAVMSQGLSPLSVEENPVGSAPGTISAVRGADPAHPGTVRVPKKAVEAFTRELANLLAGGLSLSRALALLKREASHPAARQVWAQVHDDVVGGEALAEALARWPQVFSGIYVAMVRAGEAGGFLHVVLQQISDFGEREQELTGKLKAAMIYPVVLAVVAALVLVLMLAFFIPRFSTIFDQFGSNLPWLTRAVVAVSGWLVSYGLFLLAIAVMAALVARRLVAAEAGRRAMERLILNTPSVGVTIARFALVRFCRMLGTLLRAGVPLVASLRVAREALGNQTLADTVSEAIDEVQRGTPLNRALASNAMLFPPGVIEMISVAEEAGRLDEELLRLSTAYERELDRRLRMLVALAEPALLLIMAALIGTVVVSMLLPLFTLQEMIV